MKKRLRKIRKPRNFGIRNEVYRFEFSVNKEAGLIDFSPGSTTNWNQIWMQAKNARWLAEQLNKAAEYLEQQGWD
jgi:hypothetical protein